MKHTHPELDESGIESFFHCGICLSHIPQGESPKDWARTQTGMLPDGRLRVWCNRCNVAVATLSLSDSAKEMLMNHFHMRGCEACGKEVSQ